VRDDFQDEKGQDSAGEEFVSRMNDHCPIKGRALEPEKYPLKPAHYGQNYRNSQHKNSFYHGSEDELIKLSQVG